MNQSDTLKITHKARVKFSVGPYIDTVDCDVAPLSACHLLLGRPWQFDLDATHGGRSNNYSFVHQGVNHVLKPMPESAIKAEVFATSKVKKKVAEIAPKPRTALLQRMENDETCLAPRIIDSVPDAPLIKGDITQNAPIWTSIVSGIESKTDVNHDDFILRENISVVEKVNSLIFHTTELGTSNADMKNDKSTNFADCLMKEASAFMSKPRTALFQEGENDEPMVSQNIFDAQDTHENISKPRTALFKEGEDDEPMAPQVNLSASVDLLGNNMKEFSFIKFGSFSFEEWQSYLKRILASTSTVASKTLFTGANLMKKIEKKEAKKIYSDWSYASGR
jgi:hypothetical protein